MKGCKKVYSNLLAQNVYVRDCCVNLDKPLERPSPTYLSLDEVLTDNGVSVVEKIEEYPITPEYVNSFVDSADYRNNIVEAVSQSSLRSNTKSNLGDIRSVQDVLSKNPDIVNSLYSQLLAKFKSEPKSEPKPEPKPDSKNLEEK